MNLDPAVFPLTSGKLEALCIPKSRGTAAVFLSLKKINSEVESGEEILQHNFVGKELNEKLIALL